MPAAYLQAPAVEFRQTYQPGCTTKIAYDSPASAKHHQRKFGNITCLPYRCQYCGAWHASKRGKLWSTQA